MAARGYLCVLSLGSNTVGICQDMEPSLTAKEQDITARQNKGFDANQPGQRSLTLNPKVLWVPTDAAWKLIEAAFFNQTTLSFTALDELGAGWGGVCNVYDLKRGENLNDAVTATCTLKSTGPFYMQSGSTTYPAP